MDKRVENAYQKAIAAQSNAYAPYSKFHVGSALQVKGSDEVITGFNVENASYGATVCAERTAMYSALTQGHKEFEFAVVVTNMEPPAPPCALCLQVLVEFCPPDFPVYLGNKDGIKKKATLGELLPVPFNKF